jgi:hypothetical protein
MLPVIEPPVQQNVIAQSPNIFSMMNSGIKKKLPQQSNPIPKRQCLKQTSPVTPKPAMLKVTRPKPVVVCEADGNHVLDDVKPWHVCWELEAAFLTWLGVDKQGGLVYCEQCRRTQQKNIFNEGKPVTDSWSRGQLRDHACDSTKTACKKHGDAKDECDQARLLAASMKQSRRNKLSSIIESLAVVIRGVYWLCLENVAMAKLASLFKMIRALPGMRKLETVDDMAYVNAARCREFVMSLSAVLKGWLWKD